MLRRLIIAIATASVLGMLYFPTDASARRARAAGDGVPNWDLPNRPVIRAGLSTLNEGQQVEYEIFSNRGKESADNLKVARSSAPR